MTNWTPALVAGIAYGIGCLSTGYYLVRWRTGNDLRTTGSGSTGGRNAGRSLGRTGFALTVAGDVLKGALAVGLARIFCPHPAAAPVALLAVIAGHIWPVQLGFRGGKGLAPALGGLLVFDPVLTGGLLALTLLCYGVIRRFGVSGLVALAVAPVLSCALRPPLETVTVALLAALVLWAHRANIGRVFAVPAHPAAGGETAPDTP